MQSEVLPPILETTDPLHGQLVDLWNRTGRPSILLLPTSGKFYRVEMQYSAIYNTQIPLFQELPTVVNVIPFSEIPVQDEALVHAESLLPPTPVKVVKKSKAATIKDLPTDLPKDLPAK